MQRTAALLFLSLTAILPLRAEKRALIIAIGAYSPASGLPVLDGPPNDAAAISELLTRKLGFTDVHTLLGPQATRAAIVDELIKLKTRVRPGDYVVFYYSGHGTSVGDPNGRAWGLDPNTGALLPWDIRPGQPAQVNAQLIIGRRDLRPVFTEIDKTATLFAIFDTCYSADAAKSAVKHASARFVPPSALTPDRGISTAAASKKSGDLDADTVAMAENREQSAFPYQQVISLAAAGKFQTAADISVDDLRHDPSRSYDGKPHGVLTEAILRGMTGEADKNRDGRISHDELYNYLQERAVRWSHQPVMQTAPVSGPLLASTAFETVRATVPLPAPAANRTVLVKTEGLAADLTGRIARLPRTALARPNAPFDLLARRTPSGFDLFDSSDAAVSDAPLSEEALLARIAAQPQVRDLIDLAYPQQFNVALRMNPDDQSVWFDGQTLEFTARPDQPAYLLLLNVDVTGVVTVIYPFRAEPVRFQPGQYAQLGVPSRIQDTFGIEYMKLFAFAAKPADYNYWNAGPDEHARMVVPGTPGFGRLMRMLQSEKSGRAETRMRVMTAPRPK